MKPYPSYMESGIEWVGEIPSGWGLLKPKYLLHKMERKTCPDDDVVTCFRDGVVTLRKNRRTTGFTNSLKEIGYQRIHKGDLVVHEMDGFEGSIGISDSVGKSTPVYTVIEESNEYVVRYWMYLLREMSKTGFIESLSRSIRERTTEFRWRMWRELFFAIPPKQEQQQISKFLDHKTQQIDSLIEITQQKIELLKEQRTSLINHVVTKGLNSDVEMKDSGVEWIGEIPKGWNVKKLNRVCSKVRNGYVGSTRGIMKENGVKYIQGIHIKKGNVEFTPDGYYYVSEEWSQQHSVTILQEGDILVVQTGTIGNVGYLQKELENSNCHALIIVRILESEGIGRFLHYYFLSSFVQNYLQTIKTGEILYHINTKKLRPLDTLIPPIQEQQQIVGYLDKETTKIDSLVEKETQRIDLLKEYRQSLISEVVTGKVDVRDEVIA